MSASQKKKGIQNEDNMKKIPEHFMGVLLQLYNIYFLLKYQVYIFLLVVNIFYERPNSKF